MDKLKKDFIIKFLDKASETQLNEIFNKVVELETGKNNFVPYIPYYPRVYPVIEDINPIWVTTTVTGVKDYE